jgi:hypothetical protein
MMTDTDYLDEQMDEWVDRVLQGFAEEVNALEAGEPVDLDAVSDEFIHDLKTLLLSDALRVGKENPQYVWDTLNLKRCLYQASANLISHMMDAVEDMADDGTIVSLVDARQE